MTEATRRFEEARRLLVLAALSYRGFQSGLTPQLQSERVHGAVERGLIKLADVCGMWELVWGPVTCRAPFSIVDDNLMFVRERLLRSGVDTAGLLQLYERVWRGKKAVSE